MLTMDESRVVMKAAVAAIATEAHRPGRNAPSAACPDRLIELSLLRRIRMPFSIEGTPVHPGIVASADQLHQALSGWETQMSAPSSLGWVRTALRDYLTS